MGKTIDELRAELADTESECKAARKAWLARVGSRDGLIDRRHAGERLDAANEARDAAETALFAALDAGDVCDG
jgi:hypothetical protein